MLQSDNCLLALIFELVNVRSGEGREGNGQVRVRTREKEREREKSERCESVRVG